MASSSAVAARGDAAQAAFDRKISHYRREIPELRAPDIVHRHLLWTADSRPHPADTRTYNTQQTLQRAATVSKCQQKALQHEWKHEMQITFLRRRAVVTRAVLPHTSAGAESPTSSTGSPAVGSEHTRLMEEMTARMQTQEQTPQYQMTTTTTRFFHQPADLKLVAVARAPVLELPALR